MIGLITGALLPLIKEGLGFAQNWQDNKHELALLNQQAAIQEQIGASKLDATIVQSSADDRASTRSHDRAIMRNASSWVVNINGLVRPIITLMALGILGYGFLWASPELRESAQWLVYMEILSAIIAFWFSDRSIAKKRGLR